MRRVIGVGSALTLLVFVAALVILLIPQPCPPATPGSRFYLCIPVNLVEGLLLALVAATLATLMGLVGLIHSVITRRRGHALVLGVGLLAVAPGSVLAVIGILTSAMRTVNLNELTALRVSLALLAIITAPLLAIGTLRYSGAQAARELMPAENTE
jgi:hypothetical protein